MDENALRDAYTARLPLLKTTAGNLEQKVRDDLAQLDHIDRVTFRGKGLDSFVAKVLEPKVDPPYDHPLTEVADRMATV